MAVLGPQRLIMDSYRGISSLFYPWILFSLRGQPSSGGGVYVGGGGCQVDIDNPHVLGETGWKEKKL